MEKNVKSCPMWTTPTKKGNPKVRNSNSSLVLGVAQENKEQKQKASKTIPAILFKICHKSQASSIHGSTYLLP